MSVGEALNSGQLAAMALVRGPPLLPPLLQACGVSFVACDVSSEWACPDLYKVSWVGQCTKDHHLDSRRLLFHLSKFSCTGLISTYRQFPLDSAIPGLECCPVSSLASTRRHVRSGFGMPHTVRRPGLMAQHQQILLAPSNTLNLSDCDLAFGSLCGSVIGEVLAPLP